MITFAKTSSPKHSVPDWHQGFLAMLPAIRRHAMIVFRGLKATAREEAVQEMICNAFVAYHRLFDLGKTDIAYPSVLARYGVAQYRAGRRVGARSTAATLRRTIASNARESRWSTSTASTAKRWLGSKCWWKIATPGQLETAGDSNRLRRLAAESVTTAPQDRYGFGYG